MLNFKIKIGNERSFNAKVNNQHSIRVGLNHLHDFSIKMISAIIDKVGEIDNKVSSSSYIGNQERKLSLFENTMLKDLPLKLKEFGGMYVYLKSFVKFNNSSRSYGDMRGTLIATVKLVNGIVYNVDMKGMVKSFNSWTNSFSNNVSIQTFTRKFGSILNDSKNTIELAVSSILARFKIFEVSKSSTTTKGRYISFARFIQTNKLSTEILDTKLSVNKAIKLSQYNGVKLNALPVKLKDTCYKTT